MSGNYVYIRSEPGLWTVGFYKPDGKFEPESDEGDPEEAARRVHYLNGGGSDDDMRTEMSAHQEPLGLDNDPNEWRSRRDLIGEVSTSAAGNTVLRIGTEGDTVAPWWKECAYVVLSPRERDELVKRLTTNEEES